MKRTSLITILIILTLQGCINREGEVERVDPRDIRETNTNYGAEDLHIFTKSMIQSLLRSKLFKQTKPYLAVEPIHLGEGVDEHIDTQLIRNSLRNQLLKSQKLYLVNHQFNKERAVDYLLSGDIHSIKRLSAHSIDNFYSLSLQLTDTKSSLIVWTEKKEIRKIAKN